MELVDKFAQARLCPPTVGQLAADAAYRMDPAYFEPIRDEYRRRRDLVVEGLRQIPGTLFHVPEGAFYLMTRLPVSDAEDVLPVPAPDFSWKGQTVMLTPGQGFYSTPGQGRDEVRIAYVLECGRLAEAMEVLGRALEAYAGR